MKKAWDDYRDIVIPGNKQSTIDYSVELLLTYAEEAIKKKNRFSIALSGGSTPQAIFQKLSAEINRTDWSKWLIFWSDERSVPPNSSESNYKMAMDAGFSSLPIPSQNIFRMQAENDLEVNALHYEQTMLKQLPSGSIDVVMLGVGDDGHTVSLFPGTEGIKERNRLVIANYVPEKQTWRMTFTYKAIDLAHHICIFALGKSKAEIVKQVLTGPYIPDELPVQAVGSKENKALWILDDDAAALL